MGQSGRGGGEVFVGPRVEGQVVIFEVVNGPVNGLIDRRRRRREGGRGAAAVVDVLLGLENQVGRSGVVGNELNELLLNDKLALFIGLGKSVGLFVSPAQSGLTLFAPHGFGKVNTRLHFGLLHLCFCQVVDKVIHQIGSTARPGEFVRQNEL